MIHNALKEDKRGIIHDITVWFMDIVSFIKKGYWTIDIHSVFSTLSSAQRDHMIADVKTYEEFKRWEEETRAKKMAYYAAIEKNKGADPAATPLNIELRPFPELKVVPTLTPAFVNLVKDGLKYQYVSRLSQRNS